MITYSSTQIYTILHILQKYMYILIYIYINSTHPYIYPTHSGLVHLSGEPVPPSPTGPPDHLAELERQADHHLPQDGAQHQPRRHAAQDRAEDQEEQGTYRQKKSTRINLEDFLGIKHGYLYRST